MRISDWSSDVCSSDLSLSLIKPSVVAMKHSIALAIAASLTLAACGSSEEKKEAPQEAKVEAPKVPASKPGQPKSEAQIKGEQKKVQQTAEQARSEERRVGKECVSKGRSRWAPEHEK